MCNLVVNFQKDSQIIFDPTFRENVINVSEFLNSSSYFLSLQANTHYKSTHIQFSSFQNIVKLAKNFSETSRAEPVCIVLEGPAGSFKSTFLNKLIDYLVSKNYSTYIHSCPSVDVGKDFYDDYMNQDIFIMDDVGQQGVSQWRQIINLVSPIKYPLDCA
jgi:polynucleotide 5'-kinase involved in rRNA processing